MSPYTARHIRGVLKDYRFTQPYQILATDTESVAILYRDTPLTGEWLIGHIHFDGSDRYWISLGFNQEWFRRVWK